MSATLKYNILKRFAGTETVEPTMKSRLADAAKSTAFSVVGGTLALMTVKKGLKSLALKQIKSALNPKDLRHARESYVKALKMNPFSPMSIAGNAAFGTITGLYERDIKNAIVRSNVDPSKRNDAINKLKQVGRLAKAPLMTKEAFWGSLARGAFVAAKGLGVGAKAIGYGLRTNKGMAKTLGRKVPFSHRAWGAAVKGGAVTGLGFGAHAAYKRIKREMNPRSGEYTTFLRNNMLAGNIQPGELSLPDMESVRERGMN